MFNPLVQHEDMKSSTVILSNCRHDHIRNSVVLFRKKVAQFVCGRTKSTGHPFFPCAQRQVFGIVCAAFFLWRIRFLRNMSQTTLWERNQFKDFGGVRRGKTSVADQVARGSLKPKMHDTHVSLISDLFKEHIHLHESSTGFDCFQTLQVKSARSKSWGAAHERTNAVSSFFFFAYWRDRSHVRGRGIMKQIPALMTWHCVLFPLYPFHSWMREEDAQAIHVHGCAIAVVRPERSASD